ncbi:hypothetical protein LCGC14_1541740, partial [marine sediment metagenome]
MNTRTKAHAPIRLTRHRRLPAGSRRSGGRTTGATPAGSAFTLVELPAVSKRKGRAFTLVELLVVVGIIALLVTILMPMLASAREYTRRTVCRVNLRNLTVACNLYAKDFNDLYPPYTQTGQNRGFLPYSTRNIFDAGSHRDPATGRLIPLNLAMVWEAGIVNQAEFFYCPSQKLAIYQLENYPQPWGKDNTLLNGYHRTGYMYNPHMTGRGYSRYRAYQTVSEMPANRTMVMDILHRAIAVAHWQGDVPGWNLSFGDGSARYRPARAVYDYSVEVYSYIGNSW